MDTVHGFINSTAAVTCCCSPNISHFSWSTVWSKQRVAQWSYHMIFTLLQMFLQQNRCSIVFQLQLSVLALCPVRTRELKEHRTGSFPSRFDCVFFVLCLLVVLRSIVNTSASDWLERLVSEMTYNVLAPCGFRGCKNWPWPEFVQGD